ncbi:hypothetical protein JTE90_004821 [Oedothorax gibbosus]|uniref:Uncharacterized protein n=1 Tax=Oedothorax gibbosus TaxID=931172 RepID=A0AAV6USE6_9ARAC|nr:hypothetical protein JTE90_004821 [Oedothorax gibbosus]
MMWNQLIIFFLLGTSACLVLADEDTLTPSSADDSDEAETIEQVYKTASSEEVPEPIGMPKPPKPHHHKQKENVHSHRSPVYEVVSQPCYSYGCRGGYGQEAGYQPWPSRGNRFAPYPQAGYDPRRRGPYPPPEYYPDGYYGPREPDYGYGPKSRPVYPHTQGRYGNGGYGDYSQPNLGGRFLG